MALNKNIKNIIKMIVLTLIVCGITFVLMWALGLLPYFSSKEKIKELVEMGGAFSWLIFILIQIVQVIISFVPAIATVAVGAYMFGPLLGFVYSSIGIIIGSIIAFFIGRLFGAKIARWFINKEDLTKYRRVMNKKGKLLLPLILLMPFFPDDIICLISGITTMSFGYFLIISLICRPICIFVSSFLMSGEIIPFRGWWLVLWGAIIVGALIIMWLIIKYEEKIMGFFTKRLGKKIK